MSSYRAVLTTFVLTGVVSATWASRLPAVQESLGLSAGRLSLVILAIEGGAIVGLPLGGFMVRHVGSHRALRVGITCFPVLLAVLPVAPSLPWLAFGAGLWALVNSVLDVALNTAGVELESAERRPRLSALHAGHSTGLLVGGLGAVLATKLGAGLQTHFTLVTAGALLVGSACARWLPSATSRATGGTAFPDRRLLVPGAIAFCGFLLEGGGSNWAAVHLTTQHDAGPALAASAYTIFVVALAATRYVGDRIVSRHSRRRVLQLSAAVALAGTLVVIIAPTAVLAVVGWSILGTGVALIAPTILATAPQTTATMSASAAIAAVSTMGYLGSFTGPALVGTLAAHAGLPLALTTFTTAAASAAALSVCSPGSEG